jgi:uncharacterized protein (DUF305 family)
LAHKEEDIQLRKYLIGISAAAIVLLAAGCGGDDGGDHGGDQAATEHSQSTTAGAEHNEHDMSFAQAMIPHHQQAIEMADLAAEQATDAKVKDLAARIKDAQDPEIQQLTGMLDEWGAAMGDGSEHDSHGSSDHGGMPGMMTGADMARLGKATGAAFDRLWVQMMIEHHQGAIDMAGTELESGSNADAKKLAQQIIDAQQDEIAEMQGMLS